ncbi:MAG: histidine--tRNA ligase [Candidatus Omnitrophica bacterium]|nr:histidine--tRNA ligase [Candidatus Omnitrophota bacterium]
MIYKAPRGTNDILGSDIQFLYNIYEKSREIFSLFAFEEIITPAFEDSGLFVRSLGEASDIVTKQMLNIKTSQRPLTLRPEGTASIIRAYLEHHLDRKEGFKKIFYIGPMFRGERPQKGRLRQFTHIGAEAIGSYSPALDAEIIVLMTRLLNSFGVCDYVLNLNSVGCAKDKEKLKAILNKKLQSKASRLCKDCQARLKKNILRILDCKKETCKQIVSEITLDSDFRCSDCARHFKMVKGFLNQLKVKFNEVATLVRGLDYYTGTVFEVTNSNLGSQDALGAGGRYDNLVAQLGGSDMGAVGFALGFERIALCLNSQAKTSPGVGKRGPDVFLALTKETFLPAGLSLLNDLRAAGISADIDYCNKSLKAQMRRANNIKARIVLMLGEEEIKTNKITLKDMETGSQNTYPKDEVISKLGELLKKD